MATRREKFRNRAYTIMNTAIYNWAIEHSSHHYCVDCGKAAQAYDHRDYLKPLAVDPVCNGCNVRRGRAKPIPPNAVLPDTMNWRAAPREIIALARTLGLPMTMSEVKKTSGQQYHKTNATRRSPSTLYRALARRKERK